MIKRFIILITLGLLLSISFNAYSAEQEKTVPQEELTSDKCNVYVIYPKQLYKVYCILFINGLLETNLLHTKYICRSIPYGKTRITHHHETYSEIILDTESGKNYYITIKVRLSKGLWWIDFTQVDEAEGKKLISECSIIE